MAKRGRPTLFTPEKEAEICKFLALGLSFVQTANYVGVDISSLRKYMKKNVAFARKCKQAQLTKLVMAHRNEIDLLESGDYRASQAVIHREEHRTEARKMQALRRAEIEAKNASDDRIIPAILNLNDAICEINNAF